MAFVSASHFSIVVTHDTPSICLSDIIHHQQCLFYVDPDDASAEDHVAELDQACAFIRNKTSVMTTEVVRQMRDDSLLNILCQGCCLKGMRPLLLSTS